MAQNRGYLLGRLFARLAAQGAFEQPPTQLYQLASIAPPQVIPRALATMIEAGKEDLVFPLITQLPLDAFDGPLNRREQGAFAIGYAHERTGSQAILTEDEHNEQEADLTERYEFRVEPQLKEWIKLCGGGAFIRDVLRAQRATLVQEQAGTQVSKGETKM